MPSRVGCVLSDIHRPSRRRLHHPLHRCTAPCKAERAYTRRVDRLHAQVRYVLGGFIAVADRVEHVRRLNERGNRLMLASPGDEAAMLRAERLFRWGVMLNPNCSLCFQNLGDTCVRPPR